VLFLSVVRIALFLMAFTIVAPTFAAWSTEGSPVTSMAPLGAEGDDEDDEDDEDDDVVFFARKAPSSPWNFRRPDSRHPRVPERLAASSPDRPPCLLS